MFGFRYKDYYLKSLKVEKKVITANVHNAENRPLITGEK